jgi:hypothetical protein
MSAATIKIAIEAQTAELQKGFGTATRAVKDLDANMAGAVAKGMAAFTLALGAVKAALAALRQGFAMVAESMADLDRQQKMADKLGMTADQMAALGLAAELAGESAEVANDSLMRMTKNVSEAAARGTGTAAKALEELGLHAERLNALPTDQKLGAIADAMQNVGNQNDRMRLAMEIFGRQGHVFVQMLAEGSAGLDAMAADADALGMSLGEGRRDIEAANDAIARFKNAWGAVVDQLAIAVAPAITAIANSIAYLIGTLNRWFGKSKQAVDTFTGGMETAKRKATDITVDMVKAQEEAARAAEKAAEETARRAEQITTSLRTPAEVYADTLHELNDLVRAGAIEWETYQRGVAKATEDVRKAAEATKEFQTPAIGAATAAGGAFSAIQQAQRAKADAERRHRETTSYLARIYARMPSLATRVELVPL